MGATMIGCVGKRKHLITGVAIAALMALSLPIGRASAGDTVYQYDSFGRVISITYPGGWLISYSYDQAGNRTQVVSSISNTAPVAVNDSRSTAYNTALSFDPRANDSDPNGDSLTVSAVGSAGHGSTSYTSTSVTYTPSGYSGSDSFTYTISDGNGGTSSATVYVTVSAPPNSAPVAVTDSVTTAYNTAATFDPRSNDTDANGDTLTITGVGSASHGSTSYTGTSVTYTPTSGYSGSDSFTYTINDGHGGTANGTVNMTVQAWVNTAPVCTGGGHNTGGAAGPWSFTPADAGCTDADGHTLTFISRTPTVGSTITSGGASITFTFSAGGGRAVTATVSDGHGGTAETYYWTGPNDQ